MKKQSCLRILACLLVVIMLVTANPSIELPLSFFANAETQLQPGEAFTWGFEDGNLAPFKLISGSYGTVISNIPWMHNAPEKAYPREGSYHLSTLESTTYYTAEDAAKEWADPTKMTKPSDDYMCEIHSPMFRLDDAKINFLVGGGTSGVYVALCDVYGQEIIRTSGNGSEEMIRVEWNLKYDNLVGEYVFIKIVDASTAAWGHITFDDFHANGYINEAMSIQPLPPQEIHWSFESSGLSPFKVTQGEFGVGIIANWITERNAPHGKINKDGNYYLSTVETDTTATIDESYVGTIVSPTFAIKDPEVTMKVGGGVSDENYVAIIKASDHTELVKYSLVSLPTYQYDTNDDGSKDATANSPYVFTDVTLTIPDALYTEGMNVYIKIVDGSTGENGFISVDDIRAKGDVLGTSIPTTYESIVWDFEDGTEAPFKKNGTFGNGLIATYVHNGASVPSGNYYINTILSNPGAYNWNEGYTGELVSPSFMLDPANPVITLSVNGGVASDGNYVGVFNKNTDEELARVGGSKNWEFHSETIDLSGKFNEGDLLVLKIVDSTTAGWAWIGADNIRFSGALVEYDYADTIWSFENGTYQPFTTDDTFGAGLVATYVHNSLSVPHGAYYINSVLTSPERYAFDETYVGELVSPEFMLDPANPIIKVAVNGGQASDGNFVGVYNVETGEELAKVGGKKSWNFEEASLDLTGKFKEGDRLVIKIVDGTTSSWAWIGVDYIRGSFAFLADELLTTRKQIMEATGWGQEEFDQLVSILEDYMEVYSATDYPEGEQLLEKIAEMQAAQARLATKGVKKNSAELVAWTEKMNAIADEVHTTNPALGNGLIIFTVHHQYQRDHHNTHSMFPSYNGEINNAVYTGGGSVKVLNLKTGTVTTLLEDVDGVYRDLDVSYDSNKILLSYRSSAHDTYSIFEYTLNDDRTAIIETKQLTDLSTADDMDPMYMPSGNIVFSSTRDPKYVMCNRHIAANIYRMEADGANIIKITSSTLFERPTDVLPDGRILYDRWEYNDRDFGSAQGLWTVYEDGTKQDTYYGNNSPTGATIEGKVIPGTDKVMAILSSTHSQSWGALAIINRTNGVDGKNPVEMTWPANVKNSIGDPNEAQNNIDAYRDLTVKYEDAQPLDENYFLVSRTLPGSSNNKMGLYLLDRYGNETLLYEDASSMSVFDATIIQPREKEIDTADRRNYNDDVGTFFVQDVYQGTHMQGVERGTVKTLRIVESVDKKYINRDILWNGEGQQNPGVNWHSFEVKRVIGEVPVYEDGSAYFEVPQDVFVYFQLLDEDGKMIQSMRSGTLVQSGEQTGCIGCHEDRRTAPITTTGQATPMALKANIKVIDNPDYTEGSDLPRTIAINTPDVPQKWVYDPVTGTEVTVDWNDPAYFEKYTDLPTMNFLTEVQPVFTKNCLSCHGYEDPKANLTLVPDKDVIFNAAYINLWVDRDKSGVFFENLVGAIGAGDSGFYGAKSWGSYNSPLIKKLFNDPTHMDLLTDAEKRKIAEWVDLNGTYYGDYSTNYGSNSGGRSPLTEVERLDIGDNRELHWQKMQLSSLSKSIYFDNPEKSPILKNKTGAAYEEALRTIQQGLKRLRINPDVDWAGLTAVPGNPTLSINPYRQNEMDAWRTEKVAIYDSIEAANRAAIVAGTKRYDSDYKELLEAHNAKWPGWPTVADPGNYYTRLPE